MSAQQTEAFGEPTIEVVEIDAEQGWALLDQAAREMLDMGADEFIKRWEHDDFADEQLPNVTWVSAFVPLALA